MQIRRYPPSPAVKVDNLSYRIKTADGDPRHILEEIVWHKEQEVAQMRESLSLLDLQKTVAQLPPPLDFLGAIANPKTQPALIAEVKKASPSKGIICPNFDPVAIAQAYQRGKATCLSVLTDCKFFQGSFENLALVRQSVDLPILCKEFILYPYQVYLARAKGADAVLLIAAILGDRDLQYFSKIIRALGMTALVEVHTLEELDRVLAIEDINLIGINNRNLQDFSVSLETTQSLCQTRQAIICDRSLTIVSESGIHTPQDVDFVRQAGASAILVGESLVKQPDPEQAIAVLLAAN
jgi:indole-3-glycerol phosphate synthase